MIPAPKHEDYVADPGDELDIEISDRGSLGLVLYVHVNGQCLLRVCRIRHEIEVQRT